MFASCRSCGLCVFPTVSLFHKPLTLEAKTEKQDFIKTEASEAETTHLHATCNPPSGPILCKEITKKQNKGWDYNCVFIFGALKKTAFKEESTYSQNQKQHRECMDCIKIIEKYANMIYSCTWSLPLRTIKLRKKKITFLKHCSDSVIFSLYD